MNVTGIPYCGEPPIPADIVARWNLDALPILGLIIAAVFLYRSKYRLVPMFGGLILLAVLFVSPLCALSSALFSVRVTHHVLLTALAAPLFAASLPKGGTLPWLWGALHATVFWTWHSPAAYAFALSDYAAYWLMQATLFGTALGLWRAIRNTHAAVGVSVLLASMVQMGLLGALLTFAGAPLYRWHATTTDAWGLTPLADQQLAGLIMWVPGSAIYLLAVLYLAGTWLKPRQAPAAA